MFHKTGKVELPTKRSSSHLRIFCNNMRTRDRTEQESGKMCETWTNEEIFIATSWKHGEDGYSSQEVTRIPGSLCKKSGYMYISSSALECC